MRHIEETLSEAIDAKRLTRQIERKRAEHYLRLINGTFAIIDTAQQVTASITCPTERLSVEDLVAIRTLVADTEQGTASTE